MLKAMHKERDKRYQTARELRNDIEQYLAGEPPVLPHHLAGFMEQLFPHGEDKTRLTYQALAGASPTPSVVEARMVPDLDNFLVDAPADATSSPGPEGAAGLDVTISTMVDRDRPHPDGKVDLEPRPAQLAPGQKPRGQTRVLDRDSARPPSERGWIRVLARPWARVFLDGKVLGNTPLPATATYEGTHQLVLKNDSIGVVKTLTIEVKPDQTKILKVQLLP